AKELLISIRAHALDDTLTVAVKRLLQSSEGQSERRIALEHDSVPAEYKSGSTKKQHARSAVVPRQIQTRTGVHLDTILTGKISAVALKTQLQTTVDLL